MHVTKADKNMCDLLKQKQSLCTVLNNTIDNKLRDKLIKDIFKSVGISTTIRSPIIVDTGNITIGDNCFINNDCKFIDYGGITIGNNVGISMGVTFVTNNHPCNPLTLDTWIDIAEPIIIEDNVWIGANVTILGNITIGKGSIIGAGSVVTKNIPAGEVWAGNPAKFIETVDEYKQKFNIKLENTPKKYIKVEDPNLILMTQASLDYIRKELNRHYWNKNQKEMVSPFDNTGESYTNNYMTVRAYYWGDEEDEIAKPNFEAGHMQVHWYKHSNRGVSVYFEEGYESYEELAKTTENCLKSIELDFNVKGIL